LARDVTALLGSELVEALTQLVDERVERALAERTADGDSPWLTLAEAAKRLRVSERTVARAVGRGRIRTTTLGRRRLVHRDELEAFLRAATGRE
jgi:excisionase family DNA binding protein